MTEAPSMLVPTIFPLSIPITCRCVSSTTVIFRAHHITLPHWSCRPALPVTSPCPACSVTLPYLSHRPAGCHVALPCLSRRPAGHRDALPCPHAALLAAAPPCPALPALSRPAARCPAAS
ncbi:unnamed protein product [Closterium sp. NIES-54]